MYFYQMMTLDERSGDKSDYNSCSGDHERVYQISQQSNGQDISINTPNVKLMVALKEKSGDHQSQ